VKITCFQLGQFHVQKIIYAYNYSTKTCRHTHLNQGNALLSSVANLNSVTFAINEPVRGSKMNILAQTNHFSKRIFCPYFINQNLLIHSSMTGKIYLTCWGWHRDHCLHNWQISEGVKIAWFQLKQTLYRTKSYAFYYSTQTCRCTHLNPGKHP
jgi:hypothetical protein